MKAGWEIKTLGEVCEMYQPKTISGKDMVENGAYPVFGANGIIGRYDKFNHEESQLLITCRGATCGSVNISEPKSWVTGNAMVVKPKNTSLDLKFLEYLFRGGLDISTVITGAAQPQITRTNLAPLEITYPISVKEQKRLVTLLDEAFESIATAKANAEQNLKNARALFESYLNEVFAECAKKYGHKTVGEISKHSLGKMLDKAKNKGEFKPYLRNINVRWFNFDLSDTLEMKFLPEETEKYTAVKGDVLICEGGYPGRAAIWQSDEPIFFQKALHRVRFHEIEHNKWFVYFLFSQDSSGCLRQHFTGAGIQHFTGSALKQFKIPIPPIEETKFCVAKFDTLAEETQRLESLYYRKIAALDELKKALLHRAFSGEL